MKLRLLPALMAFEPFLLSSMAWSQSSNINDYKEQSKPELEHVLVTVPIHRNQAQTALPITVLTGDKLKDRMASTIGETLNMSPGLANASFGPAVGQPVIRGQQGARVTVLQNSTGSADASNVSADHSVSVEPILAESIEVLRGPSTLLYGGGAIGGVVNVLDNRVPVEVPEQLTGASEIRWGSVNDEKTGVFKLEGGKDNLAFHLDGFKRDTNNIEIPGLAILEEHQTEQEHEGEEENTNGFIDNSDSETSSFTAGGSYIFDTGYIGLAVNRLENEYGIPPGSHEHNEEEGAEEEEEEEENIRLDIEQTRYDLRADWHDIADQVENLRWFLTYSDYKHDEIEGNGEIGTTFTNETWENRFELIHKEIIGWHGVIGTQYKLTDFAAIGEEAFIPQSDIEGLGLFVLEDYHSGDWRFELGLRLDRDEVKPDSINGDNESFNSVSYSASALYDISQQWKLGVAFSSAERAPTVEELFSNVDAAPNDLVTHAATQAIEVGGNVANFGGGDLDTEQSNNLDISLSWEVGKTSGYMTFFYNDFNDYIFLANTGIDQGGTPIFVYTQIDAEFRGIEFEFNYNLATMASGNITIDIFGDTIRGENSDNGTDIPRLPPTRIGSRINFSTDHVDAYISVINADDQDNPGINEETTEGYTRWDAGISYSFEAVANTQYTVFLKAKNLSDEQIRNSTSFLREVAPEAGRSIEAGIRLSF